MRKMLRFVTLVLSVMGCKAPPSEPVTKPALSSGSSASAAPAPPKATPIRIGYTPLIYAQPTFLALSKHLFAEAGVETTEVRFENSTQIVNAMLAGQLDFCAIAPAISVLSAENKRQQARPLFKFFYYNLDSTQHPISFVLTKAGSKLRDLSGLKGKSIGVFPGNLLSRVSMKLLLSSKGLGEDAVTFQDVSPQLQAQSLESGQVAAMVSLEPFATIATLKTHAVILHNAPQVAITDPLAAGAGFMTAQFVLEHPETTRHFYAALKKAVGMIRADPAAAKRALVEYTPLDADIADKVRQPEYEVADEMGSGLLQKEYDALVAQKVLGPGLNVKELIYETE